jgi:hypothetical protein
MSKFRKWAVVLAYVAAFGVAIAGWEWIEYHANGKSIWGLNPRCAESFLGYCFKLDSTDLSWSATIATWIHKGVAYSSIMAS